MKIITELVFFFVFFLLFYNDQESEEISLIIFSLGQQSFTS